MELADQLDVQPTFSVIIPAFNEARIITSTLQNIANAVPERVNYEIIVVDNGSSDKTPALAKSHGAEVLVSPGVSIATLRNLGAKASRGEVLVFIDADISLTEAWGHSIEETIKTAKNEKTILGSKCQPTGEEGILASYWFGLIAEQTTASYIGTGHLIVSRDNFWEIGGFNEALKTGEDFEFCSRARHKGYTCKIVPNLVVLHHGFPQTLFQFFQREAWHGRGDVSNISALLSSKVAIAAILFLFLHFFLALTILFDYTFWALFNLFLIIAFPIIVSFYKFPNLTLRARSINVFLTGIYLHGRHASVFIRTSRWR